MDSSERTLSEFTYDPEKAIFRHPENRFSEYHDARDRHIFTSLKKIHDLSSLSGEYAQYIKDQYSRDHFSRRRTNVLEAVEDILPRDATVLELGSGCGAITRWLGEHFRKVDSLEENILKATITRYRTKDLDNVTLYCGDLCATGFEGQYDLIVIVGSLEQHASCESICSDPKKACSALLNRVCHALKDDGILLIASENKLGAKSLSGSRDTRIARAFEGSIGDPDKGAATFSRNELGTLLSQSGFEYFQFYHLFPDYILAETIIPEKDETLSLYPDNWVKTPFEEYSDDSYPLFPDTLFLKTVTETGLLWHFSNSFLVLASRSENVNLTAGWLIRRYHNYDERAQVFHHTITLTGENSPSGKKQYRIYRAPMTGGVSVHHNDRYSFELMNSEYVPGRSLAHEIPRALFSQSPEEELMKIIRLLYDDLILHFSTGERDDDGYPRIRGEAIDFTFWNLIVSEGPRLVCIDKKWRSQSPIPVDFVMFRNLLHIFALVKPFTRNKDRLLFSSAMMKHIFPGYPYERFLDVVHREEAFQQFTIARDWELAKETQIRSVFKEDTEIKDIFVVDKSISGRGNRRSADGSGMLSSCVHEIMRQLTRVRTISHSRKDPLNTDLIPSRKKKP